MLGLCICQRWANSVLMTEYKYEVLKRPNMCYIFEKLVVQGYQLWSSYHHIIISSHHHIITSSYQFDGAYRRPMDNLFFKIHTGCLKKWVLWKTATNSTDGRSSFLQGHWQKLAGWLQTQPGANRHKSWFELSFSQNTVFIDTLYISWCFLMTPRLVWTVEVPLKHHDAQHPYLPHFLYSLCSYKS